MKKLLLVLLVATLAAFLFVGCIPVTPSEGEGEGEGEGEVEAGITVDIEGAVEVGGFTYVSEGTHKITITFPAPVAGLVTAYTGMGSCYDNFSEAMKGDKQTVYYYGNIIFYPNEDRTVWTGLGNFGYPEGLQLSINNTSCCSAMLEFYFGDCVDDACLGIPFVVDGAPPYAEIDISAEDCDCEGYAITFDTVSQNPDCEDAIECCGDDCSGLASWSVVLYEDYPFDVCCDPSICEEPIGSCSGTECPIICETECLLEGTYYAVVNLVDNVGNETAYYAKIVLGADGTTDVKYGWPDEETCVEWATETSDTIGICGSPGGAFAVNPLN